MTGATSPTSVAGAAEAVFVALSDPTRRAVLDLLVEHGDGTASTLASQLPVSRPAVIKHLVVLDRAGLVEAQRRGRELRYSVRSEPLSATAEWMTGVAARWDQRLSALKRLAESEHAQDPPSSETRS
jgi:DNA-binding transcriptional ArsR family regulator